VTHQILFLSQKENLVVTHTEASYRTQAMTNYPLIPLGTLSLARQNHRHSQFSEIKPNQQKKRLLQTDRARVRTACVRPIRSLRPKRPPLRPVRPERPERPGVLGLHLLRLVPPNTLVPVLTTRRTCHGLILSEHPPSVSSRPGVSRVDLPDSGSPTA